jgi:hypothetical protein
MNPIMDPLKEQVGGDHYAKLPIQPVQFAMANSWDACAFSILKYVTRHADKNGLQDIKKAIHFVELRVATLGDGGDYATYDKPILMVDYLKANRVGIAEAGALKALETWVYARTDRAKRELLCALDWLATRYQPATVELNPTAAS